jgi:hypothetical protein
MRADFTIQEGFIYFDLNLDGEIDIDDFRITCLELGLNTITQDILTIFTFGGVNHTSLEYNDFHRILLPKTETYAKILSDRQISDHYDSQRKIAFSYETKKLIGQIVQTILTTEGKLKTYQHQVPQ